MVYGHVSYLCSDVHYNILSVFNTVPSDGPEITVIQYQFSDLSTSRLCCHCQRFLNVIFVFCPIFRPSPIKILLLTLVTHPCCDITKISIQCHDGGFLLLFRNQWLFNWFRHSSLPCGKLRNQSWLLSGVGLNLVEKKLIMYQLLPDLVYVALSFYSFLWIHVWFKYVWLN